MSKSIIVGVDGSDTALAALRWAVEEASLRGLSLTLVHAWGIPSVPLAAGVEQAMSALEESGQQLLDQAVAEVAATAPDLEVHTLLLAGVPGWSLIDASDGAAMVVVGSRGKGGFKRLMLGSVSHQVAQHAHCPVVVIRPPEQDAAAAE